MKFAIERSRGTSDEPPCPGAQQSPTGFTIELETIDDLAQLFSHAEYGLLVLAAEPDWPGGRYDLPRIELVDSLLDCI